MSEFYKRQDLFREMRNFILPVNMLWLIVILLTACSKEAGVNQAIVPVAYDTSANTPTSEIQWLYKETQYDWRLAIAGDTVIMQINARMHAIPEKSDVSSLKKDPNQELVFVSVGGALTAGMRDGGLYRAGQQTSFPNLLARQMRVRTFRQALFSETQYNGYGYRTISKNNFSGTVIPKFNYVKNNLGILGIQNIPNPYNWQNIIKAPVFEKFAGQVDNYGVWMANWDYALKTPVDNWTFAKRFTLSKGNTSNSIFEEIILRKDIEFFTLECGFDGFWSTAPIFYGDNPYSFSATLELLKHFKSIGAKGCVLNIPQVINFPYYKLTNLAEIKKATGFERIYLEDPSGYNFIRDENSYFRPTAAIDSLLNTKNKSPKKGESWKNPLPVNDVIPTVIVNSFLPETKRFNTRLEGWAYTYGYPLVDIYSLYEKILQGTYVTDDGVKVDPSYPNGNFFSADGGTPTAFGQAIIANEVIKTLNNYYKTTIPLIPTREYITL